MDGMPVDVEIQGSIAAVTMRRDAAFNALNGDLRAGLRRAVSSIEQDESVRVVILKGAGLGFCAGADLKEVPAVRRPTHQVIEEEYRPILTGIASSSKLWIAQVHGAAAGIGAALAMNCDMVTIAEDASIYMAFAAIGLVPDGGNCWLLFQALGYRRAMQAIVEGRKIPAQEALELGLVNEVHAPDALDQATQKLAERISTSAPLAMSAAKRLLRNMDGMSYTDAIMAEGLEQTRLSLSDDHAEGVRAFREKRAPVFRGR